MVCREVVIAVVIDRATIIVAFVGERDAGEEGGSERHCKMSPFFLHSVLQLSNKAMCAHCATLHAFTAELDNFFIRKPFLNEISLNTIAHKSIKACGLSHQLLVVWS